MRLHFWCILWSLNKKLHIEIRNNSMTIRFVNAFTADIFLHNDHKNKKWSIWEIYACHFKGQFLFDTKHCHELPNQIIITATWKMFLNVSSDKISLMRNKQNIINVYWEGGGVPILYHDIKNYRSVFKSSQKYLTFMVFSVSNLYGDKTWSRILHFLENIKIMVPILTIHFLWFLRFILLQKIR